jgi:hypothetical protein
MVLLAKSLCGSTKLCFLLSDFAIIIYYLILLSSSFLIVRFRLVVQDFRQKLVVGVDAHVGGNIHGFRSDLLGTQIRQIHQGTGGG